MECSKERWMAKMKNIKGRKEGKKKGIRERA